MLEIKWNAATVRIDADEVDWGVAVVVADAHGERPYSSLDDAMSSDPALVVTPETVIERVGGLPEGEVPDESFFEGGTARWDPLAWSGTYFDECWGEGNWHVQLDGEQVQFHLTWCERAAEPLVPSPAGTLIELVNGGWSMTTGEIGMSVGIDEYGATWAHRWGMDTWYLGPVGDADLLAEAQSGINVLDNGATFDIFHIRTGLLTAEQLHTVVERLLDDPSYVLVTETTVAGPGLEATIAEMFPGRVRSIEETFGGDS